MTYESWLEENNNKIKEILSRASLDTPAEIARYFKYENMVEKEPNFCPLYKDRIKCHDVADLNCYFCGCPYFRIMSSTELKDENKNMIVSMCVIDSKYKDKYYEDPDENNIIKLHCDCSKCYLPHKTTYVERMLNKALKNNVLINDTTSLIDYIRLKQLDLLPNVNTT